MEDSYMEDAFKGLAAILLEKASKRVEISRDGTTLYSGYAILGKTEYEDADRSGSRVSVYAVDFIIKPTGYEPRRGDVVECGGDVYVVKPVQNELWRYADPFKTALRVHAQRVADR